MPKQLINIIGIVVCAGILGVALALVALPIYFQSLATGSQTADVAQTNNIYQIQVDGLRVQEERMGEIEASVAQLSTQIPAENDLDAVFELIARAATAADVNVINITAGPNAIFVPRTDPMEMEDIITAGEEAAAEAPVTDAGADESGTTDPSQTADSAAAESTDPAAPTDPAEPTEPTAPVTDEEDIALEGPQQVDFTITLEASNVDQAVAFLDRLRVGPRLFTPIESTVIPTGTGYDVSVLGLTYVLPEE